MTFWDESFEAAAAHRPDVRPDGHHIDIMAARFVVNPEQFDIVDAVSALG